MTTTDDKDSNNGARLPVVIVPIHYDVVYRRIDLVNHNFEGSVTLTGTAAESNRLTSITLHALEVQLIHAKFGAKEDDETQSEIQAEEFRYHRLHQTCEISFPNDENSCTMLTAGTEYVLKMDFVGVLNDQMRGFYRSTYKGMDGNMHTMATTQFEPTEARRAFPCMDEPALKATFQFSATIPAHLQCISNTPLESTHTSYNENGKLIKTVTFQTTPKMSTYLVAVVVGEFDGISKTSRKIVTTVYTVPGKASQGHFCLDVATRCLDLYQDLFKIDFPLTKSDLLAIPDFAAGAMENWGCVTYREAKVLVKPNMTSETIRRGIARTVCHELAHQWFGNLVTMDWWTQLYLKEGMARFFEFVACTSLFPEWNMWTEFVQSVYGMAMGLDAMKSSHPVEVEVHHPDEIDAIFDSISYAKGASIIRMIASYIGMETFFEGMRTYLTRHAYGNTITNDLWKALEEVSGKPVVKFMEPWSLQMGYPILLLKDDGSIEVERFFADGPDNEKCTPWPVPVTAKVEGTDEILGPWVINNPTRDEKDQLEKNIKEWSASSKWFKLNIEQTAFFRVDYSKEQWHRLAPVMSPNSPLSTTDRLGLISDCFAAGKAGFSSIVDALMLVENFGEHETADYAVWQELSENLSALEFLYRSEPFLGSFQSFLKRIYSRQMEVLGWEPKQNESGRTGTLRSTVISMMGKANDSRVLQKAHGIFIAHKDDPDHFAISGDVRSSIFNCALRFDDAVVFDGLKKIYENSNFPEEQRNCLAAMGRVQDPKRHAEMLDYVFNSGKVRLQDISIPLASLSSASDEGGRATWEYFKSNFIKLESRLVSGPMWAVCVGLCCRGLSTIDEANEVEAFFQFPRSPGSAKKRLTQALEVVRTKAKRRDRDREDVGEYFQGRSD